MASPIREPIASFRTTLTNKVTATATTFYIDSVTDDDGNSMNGLVLDFLVDRGKSTEEYIRGTVDSATMSLTSVTRKHSVKTGESLSATGYAHAKKAVIEISEHPAVAQIARRFNGTDAFDADNRPILDVDQDATDDKEFVSQGQLNRTAMGGVTTSRVLCIGTAGETVAAGNLVYLKVSDGEWYKCDADTAATVDNILLGIAQGAGTDGNTISGGVLLAGIDTNQSGMTIGAIQYASNTAGAIGGSAGTTEVVIGQARTATNLYFWPRYAQQLTEDQQDALAGTSGTPSNSNKYVTNDDTSATAAASKVVRSNGSSKIAEGYLQMTDAQATDLTDGGSSTAHYHPRAAIAATRDLTAASGAVTHAHGLGVAPKWVKVTAFLNTTAGSVGQIAHSVGHWDGTTYACAYNGGYVSGSWALAAGTSTSYVVNLTLGGDASNDNQTATVSVDATNVTLTWTKNNTPAGTAILLIECGF